MSPEPSMGDRAPIVVIFFPLIKVSPMNRRLLILMLLLAMAVTRGGFGQDAGGEAPQLQQRLEELQRALGEVDSSKPGFVDAAVCAKAAEWILRHQEFFKPNYVDSTKQTLDLGFQRMEILKSGKPDWGLAPGNTLLAYRSRIDESLQPYALTLPTGFKPGEQKRWPLYVVLHGRNGGLNEAHFIAQNNGKAAPKDQAWIQLDVYGRGNNAYRWAGETDVFEALGDVLKRYRIDERRITLWGFSMGGAGAWHLGLHHPSRWASVGGGAGFVDFYAYQKRTDPLPDYQHRALRIYDAKDYSLNLNLVPFITYGGENDAQLLASTTMKAAADEQDVPLTMLVGPGMGHKFDEPSLKTFMAFLAEHNQQGRPPFPGKREFDFETYTLKYNRAEWLTIEEQEVPCERSLVSVTEDDGILDVTTSNVAALSVARGVADQMRLDASNPFGLTNAADGNLPEVFFVKEGDTWRLLDYDDSLQFMDNRDRRKRHNLQGPIDDAFMEPFLCVRGTGEAWSAELQAYAQWSLDRFATEHDKWLRGTIPLKDDSQVTADDLQERNLILFGDPGSNRLLTRIKDSLPCQWNQDSVTFGGQTYSTKDHALVLIYPNPLNPRKYVVVNTGATVREKDFKASNAWLFPKLGDHAVIRFERQPDGSYVEETVSAGIFDSAWEIAE